MLDNLIKTIIYNEPNFNYKKLLLIFITHLYLYTETYTVYLNEYFKVVFIWPRKVLTNYLIYTKKNGEHTSLILTQDYNQIFCAVAEIRT